MQVPHLSPRALIKEILHSSSLYSIAPIGQRLASFILLPILTRYLTPADYGALDLLEQIGVVASLLMGANFSDALGYYYFHKDNEGKGDAIARTVTTTLLGSLLIGSIPSVCGWFLAPALSRAVFGSASFTPYIRVVLAFLCLSFLYEGASAWLRIENRTGVFVLTALSRTVLIMTGVIVLIAGLGWRIAGMLGANLAALTLVTVPLTLYCFRIYRPSFDVKLFARMIRYAIPLVLSGLGMFVIHFGDRFILPHYRSFQELGVYAIAYKIGMLISLVNGSFLAYWNAQIFRIVRRDDASVVFARVFTYMMAVLSFCALGLIVAASPVLRVFTTPLYYGAAVLVPVIVFAYVLRAIGDFFRAAFFAEGRPGSDATVQWIGAAICLAGYFILIPRFGAMGAAAATLVTFLVIAILAMFWVYRIYPYRLERARVLKIAAVTAALISAHFLLPASSLPMQIASGIALLAAYVLLLIVWRVPNESEWSTIVSVFQRYSRASAKAATDL